MPGLHRLSALAATRGQPRGGCRSWSSTAGGSATPRRSSPRSRSTRPSRRSTGRRRGARAARWRSRTGSTRSSAPSCAASCGTTRCADTDVVARTLFARPSPVRERFLRATRPGGAPGRAARLQRDRRRPPTAGATRSGRRWTGSRAELGPSGYLVGDRFTVADLTAASLFTPLLSAARAALRAHGRGAGGAGAARRAHGAARRRLGARMYALPPQPARDGRGRMHSATDTAHGRPRSSCRATRSA